MANQIEFYIFVIISFVYVTLWARSSEIINGGYFGPLGGSKFLRQLSYRIMGIFKTEYTTAYSSLMCLNYFGGAVLVILVSFLLYRENIFSYFYLEAKYIDILILGTLAEISLANIFSGFFSALGRQAGINTIDEICNVKWITGISLLPKFGKSLTVVLAAFFEEVTFRGVFIVLAINHYHANLWIVIILSSILFVYDQVIQLDTPMQKYMIGSASFVISVIGALMVFETGSIFPAVFAHSSFVIFYFSSIYRNSSGAFSIGNF